MSVMTQLSGVSSPFSLLGFMYPPVRLHIFEGGSLALAQLNPNSAMILAVVAPLLTFQIESRSSYSTRWQVGTVTNIHISGMPFDTGRFGSTTYGQRRRS